MQDNILIKAPAKLNLFLRVLEKRIDNYHNIFSGITFLNLFDEISIKLNYSNDISYSGPFKPDSLHFDNDIILYILDNFLLDNKSKIKINIKKNIPWKAGLGSASTNAACLIKGLEKLGLTKKITNHLLSKIGADVPACYYGKNCLVTGIGDKVEKTTFPKYYIVLVYPKIPLSTKNMYMKIGSYNKFSKDYNKQVSNLKNINHVHIGNDFERIVKNENKYLLDLLNFLSNIESNIFSSMTGSGSCCYVVFKKKEDARKAFSLILKKYRKHWIYLSENNIISN